MAITALPTPPSRQQPEATFATNADNFLGALPTFVTEANARADGETGIQGSAETTRRIIRDTTSEGGSAASRAAASDAEATTLFICELGGLI